MGRAISPCRHLGQSPLVCVVRPRYYASMGRVPGLSAVTRPRRETEAAAAPRRGCSAEMPLKQRVSPAKVGQHGIDRKQRSGRLAQLASHNIRNRARNGELEVAADTLKEEVRAEARRMADDDFAVDERLLNPRAFERRWQRFRKYCQQRHYLKEDAGTLRFNPERILDESLAKDGRARPFTRSANELDTLLATREETPMARP